VRQAPLKKYHELVVVVPVKSSENTVCAPLRCASIMSSIIDAAAKSLVFMVILVIKVTWTGKL
jgi:hypothetical protein